MIKLIKVGKTFTNNKKSVRALSDISLDVKKGNFISLIGPSGCGKTSLLRIVGAIMPASEGEVFVDGYSPHAALSRHYFGFVFQEPTLLPWRNVIKNIQLPGEILSNKEAAERAYELIRLVGLESFSNSYPKELSGGMKTRVAIARTLSFHPSILLMDEPFGSLDEITRDTMNFELLQIWRKIKTTVMFVTHSINEAVLLSDKVVVLTSRPARIKEIVDIPLSRPRSTKMRGAAEFAKLTEGIREQLLP